MRTSFIASGILVGLAMLVAAGAMAAAGGLVDALGCGACHDGVAPPEALRRALPDLSRAGLRYRTGYVFDYLRAPRRVRRHLGPARMPDFRLREDEAVALARFLASQRTWPDGAWPAVAGGEEAGPPPPGDDELRSLLGRRHSCLACHRFRGVGGARGPSLDGVGARLRPVWLKRFLVAPSRFGVPDALMPALLLRPSGAAPGGWSETEPGAREDLGRIVAGLVARSSGRAAALDRSFREAAARHPEADAAMGRRIFGALGCVGCHRHAEIAPTRDRAPPLAGEGRRVRPAWLLRYLERPTPLRLLGTPPGSGSRMPDFHLTTEEARTIARRLGIAPEREKVERSGAGADVASPLSAFARAKARSLLERKLPCLGCHALGGDGGRIGPPLDAVARRLGSDFLERLLRSPRRAVPWSVMPDVPMPERTRLLLVRFLGEQRGPAPERTYPSLVSVPPIEPAASGGRGLYLRFCAGCHGPEGRGDGPNARYLPVAPTAHADGAAMERRSDDVLFDAIFAGAAPLGRSPRMPPWGRTLDEEQIESLVGEVRRLCSCRGPVWADQP